MTRIPGAARRTRTGAAAASPVLPDFLDDPGFEVMEQAVVERAAQRRTVELTSASNVSLTTRVPSGTLTVLVARQASGAISFHRPLPSVTARGLARAPNGRRGAGEQILLFEVPVSVAPGGERRGPLAKIVRVALVKVADALVGALLEQATRWAVPRLARLLEQRLWARRTQGWVSVSAQDLLGQSDALPPGRPDMARGERGLLLLHGTFSTTHGSFRALARSDFFAKLAPVYGRNIFGFDHFSFSKTPDENVQELLDALPDRDLEFDIISHSRGGLVARALLEGAGRRHPKAKRLKIGQLVMVACPAGGTPLADPAHWEQKLAFWANLLELLPDNPLSTAGGFLAEALRWVAANVLGQCPGLAAMDPDGDYIRTLQAEPGAPASTPYHALASNFAPPQGWLARLADMGVDTFFGGANDLVVPSEGAWRTADKVSGWVPAARIACFGPGGNLPRANVHHLSFFAQPETSSFLLASLGESPSGLAPLDPRKLLPSRDVRRFSRTLVAADRTLERTATDLESEAVAPAPPARVEPARLAAEQTVAESLYLTVVSQAEHTEIEHERAAKGAPLLLASYSSARVTVPFYTEGAQDNAGQRWQMLIRMQRFLHDYANGKDARHELDGEEIDFPTDAFLRAFGKELFRTLFPATVRNLYDVARYQQRQRRLNLIFTSTIPWVADFSWELAFDSVANSFLACADVSFTRNVLTPTPPNRIVARKGPLRLLVVSAQPTGMGRLSIEDERRSIYESFAPLIKAGLAQVEVLAGTTPALLHERLRYAREDSEFDVLHFIGHGEFDSARREGCLFFEDESGRPNKLSAASFLNIVRGRNLRVVFLNACETGRGARADYNRGVAMALAQDGIPAVVANQYSVIDRSASLFSLHFYACLARGLSLGNAMREARVAIQYCGVEPMDWGVPVLFSGAPDARLCELAPASSVPVPTDSPLRTFQVLSSAPSVERRAAAATQQTIALWDAENSLVYRENLAGTARELNEAQDSFVLNVERFSAPRNLWLPDRDNCYDGVAYLSGERVAERMERICQRLGYDFLFCVTDLPLRDEHTTALYFYQSGRIAVLSTWALTPALTGLSLKQAIANYVAITLLTTLAQISRGGAANVRTHPKHTLRFFNQARDVAHITGRMTMAPATEREIRAALRAGSISERQVEAIQTLLGLYHRKVAKPRVDAAPPSRRRAQRETAARGKKKALTR